MIIITYISKDLKAKTLQVKRKAVPAKPKQGEGIPNAEESITLWSELWNHSIDYNINTEWMMTVQKELENITQQGEIIITKEQVSKQLRKTPVRKAPGHNGLH